MYAGIKAIHLGKQGSVENANKLVRQYFLKGTNFDDIENQTINAVQKNINNRPRKIINFQNPKTLFFITSQVESTFFENNSKFFVNRKKIHIFVVDFVVFFACFAIKIKNK